MSNSEVSCLGLTIIDCGLIVIIILMVKISYRYSRTRTSICLHIATSLRVLTLSSCVPFGGRALLQARGLWLEQAYALI